jgi:hypothetical protein
MSDQTHRSKVWEVMNELDMFPSKLIILKHLTEGIENSIINRDINHTEYLITALQDLVEHYTDDFEKKFQVAWQQTLATADVADEKLNKSDCMPPWGHSDQEYLGNSVLTKDRISNFPGEQYPEEVLNAMCDAAEAQQKKSWTVPVEETPDGETLLSFPDELIKAVGWVEGDNLKWIDNKDGTFTLKKA